MVALGALAASPWLKPYRASAAGMGGTATLRSVIRAAEATAVPPELAEQIASAVRMLHESPTIEREAPRPPKVTRIERDADGNFVPVYDDHPV